LNSIKATLNDYIEGSTNGQPERLKSAFHNNLNFYSIRQSKLQVWSGKEYIEDTKPGISTGESGEILAIDFEHNTAVAKIKVSPQNGRPFIDYFMLLKIGQKWTIVHKMYTVKNKDFGVAGSWSSQDEVQFPNKREDLSSNVGLGSKTLPETDSNLTGEINSIFAEYDRPNSAGAAVCVLKNGRVVFKRAYGNANIEHQIPIDPNKTLFNIGSTSKQFTAFAALLLAAEGKLSMDDDVRKHIPELSGLPKITLRQLAQHTSGIRSELNLLAMAGWTPGDVIRPRHILKILSKQESLNFQPGTKFEYSNSGFTLLAEVVARVSEQPFDMFCRNHIFTPLEMGSSSFSRGYAELRYHRAYSYSHDGQNYFPADGNDEYSGSTGLWTTLDDLAKWARNFETIRIGSKEILDEMETLGLLQDGSRTSFGMGLAIEHYRGVRQIQHGGATSGFVSFLSRFPQERLMILLLANTSAINGRQFANQIADSFLKKKVDSGSDSNQEERSTFFSHSDLGAFAGQYWSPVRRVSGSIGVQNGELVYTVDGGPQIGLIRRSETQFEMRGVGLQTTIDFKRQKSGGYSIRITEGEREVDRLVAYKTRSYSEEELADFCGTFYCSELGTAYEVSSDGGGLTVDHQRFENVRLSPLTNDVFRSSGWRFSSLAFERNQQGDVTGFSVNSTRNQDLQFKRFTRQLSERQIRKSTTSVKKEADLSSSLDDAVKKCMIDQHLPGLAVVVVKDGKTILKRGFGFANVQTKTLVDPDRTLFRIGSVSKALTFLALTRLIDDGRVKRSDSVEKFIGDIPNPFNFSSPVTIDHLLTHTSGFDQIGTKRHVYRHELSLEQRKALRPSIAFTYSTSPDTFERESANLPYPQIQSIAQKVFDIISEEGHERAIDFFLQNVDSQKYYLREDEMNRVGLILLQANQDRDALEIFKLNVVRFPSSWKAHDSLGDAYIKLKDTQKAIASFQKSIELNLWKVAIRKKVQALKNSD
ncbi:MAG: serine hydrolase, partial [Planctomycetota bacterium]